MAAGNVDLVIDQGEDWTAQIIWTDYYDNPVAVSTPMRMTIKSPYGAIVRELVVPVSVGAGEIPEIAYNPESGLIQLHLDADQTRVLQPGAYPYDLWVSVTDDVYAGIQSKKLIYGLIYVAASYTKVI